MELTWITIAASLCMGLAALFFFIFAVKRDWMKDLEDAKYQVFWADPNEGDRKLHGAPGPGMAPGSDAASTRTHGTPKEAKHGGQPEKK